jgi:hypothetical protein
MHLFVLSKQLEHCLETTPFSKVYFDPDIMRNYGRGNLIFENNKLFFVELTYFLYNSHIQQIHIGLIMTPKSTIFRERYKETKCSAANQVSTLFINIMTHNDCIMVR